MLQKGRTALMKASEEGHLEVVQLLLSSGASVNIANEVSVRVISDIIATML